MNIGQKINELRKQQGYSLEELANKLNVHRQTISRWEWGQSVPNADDIKKLSEVLGVSVDYLVNDEVDLTNKIDIAIQRQEAEIVATKEQNAMLMDVVANMQKDIDLIHKDNEIAAAKEKKAKAKKTKAWLICSIVVAIVIALVVIPIGMIAFNSNKGIITAQTSDFVNLPLTIFVCLIVLFVIMVGIIIGIAIKNKRSK